MKHLFAPTLLPPDSVFAEIADYVTQPPAMGELVYRTSLYVMLDGLACAAYALQHPDCARMVAPLVTGANLPFGARVPGTALELDPVAAAFGLTLCQRWDGLQSVSPSGEGVSPSDPIAAILMVSDWLGRNIWHSGQLKAHGRILGRSGIPPTVHDVLTASIAAQEIQGALAVANPWKAEAIDTSAATRIATSAALARLLGGTKDEVLSAVELAWMAGVSPCLGGRAAAWRAADNVAQSVAFAIRALVVSPENYEAIGLRSKKNGFEAHALQIARPLGLAFAEQIFFNLAHPDALSAQTAGEAALKLFPVLVGKLHDIESIEISTHAAGLALEEECRQSGEKSWRQRSLSFCVASALIQGRLEEASFVGQEGTEVASLRSKVRVHEESQFTLASNDPDKHALPNAVQVRLRDGTVTEKILVEYPIGHYRRRAEAVPLLFAKAESCLGSRFEEDRVDEIIDLFDRPADLLAMPVTQFVDLWSV